ncbi:unnamed protein product [Cyprideis torosa]|uniref:Uncharacterized protein n=1 Tax=Cyprideis torosa TaxID=163714 RepID=A0A7R8ZJZ3_9CRUS|nr:unnamed protein product [Cyprideis torosa]CAG0879234.1 unnamed protein product [Cyprideis torosa]
MKLRRAEKKTFKSDVGMVKQPGPATAEFQMSSEDFPALPGTTGAAPTPVSTHDVKTSEQSNAGLLSNSALPITSNSSTSNADALKALVSSSSRGVRMSPDGRISNIPPGIMTDQFGMLGLLTFLRNKDSNPNLSSLALGQDLTQLGLNLNSPEVLHPTFAGPWQDSPCRPQDVSYPVPSEYIVSPSIRDSLAPLNLCRYGDDLLFYIFYMYVQDLLQIAAAAELYDREWRYHKGEGVWITRAPGIPPVQKTTTFERGTYFVFDVGQWKKVAKELVLEYDKLEARPSLPSANSAIIPPPLPSNH